MTYIEEPTTDQEIAVEQGWDYPDPETEMRYDAEGQDDLGTEYDAYISGTY